MDNINENKLINKYTMNKIKFLKNNYIQLNKITYKPHTICDLPNSFGMVDNDGNSLITEWFNYKGFTYIAI